MTNGEKIRGMTDEELATMLCNTCTFEQRDEIMLSTYIYETYEMPSTYGDILEWLKQPVEE